MALVISAVTVTGTATAYTVPVGKVAKVRVTNITDFTTNKIITIGNYRSRNQAIVMYLSSEDNNKNNTTNTNSFALPIAGFVRLGSINNFDGPAMYIKEDHVLVAGQTVSVDDAGATVSYTIFEEDA